MLEICMSCHVSMYKKVAACTRRSSPDLLLELQLLILLHLQLGKLIDQGV